MKKSSIWLGRKIIVISIALGEVLFCFEVLGEGTDKNSVSGSYTKMVSINGTLTPNFEWPYLNYVFIPYKLDESGMNENESREDRSENNNGGGEGDFSASSAIQLPRIIALKTVFDNSGLESEYQFGSLKLTVGDFQTSDPYFVVLYNSKEEIFYSLSQLIEMCGGKITKEGYYFDSGNKIFLNPSKGYAMLLYDNSEHKVVLNSKNYIMFNGEPFLNSKILDKYFEINSSFVNVTASFAPKFVGYNEEKGFQEVQRRSLELKNQGSNQVDASSSGDLFSLGRVQLSYSLVNSSYPSLFYTYLGQLLYGTLYLSGSTSQNPFFTTGYLQYEIDKENVLTIGKNIYTSQYNYFSQGGTLTGVYYGKANVTNVGYGTITFSGEAYTGRLVELYRGKQLIAFQYAVDSRYLFDDIVIQSPRDTYKIRIYQEDGTYRDRFESVYSAMGFLDESEWSTSLSGGKVQGSNGSNNYYLGEVAYGVSPDLTVAVGGSQGLQGFSEGGTLYYKNAFLVPNYFIGQVSSFAEQGNRYSVNQYYNLNNAVQLNVGYLNFQSFGANTVTTNLYLQSDSGNYTLGYVGNYTNSQTHNGTISQSLSLFQRASLTNTIGVNQISGVNGYQYGQQISYSPISNYNVLGGYTVYTVPNPMNTYTFSLLFSEPNYNWSIKYLKDTLNNDIYSFNFGVPVGLGLVLDSLSGTTTSNQTSSLNVTKNILLSHPLKKASGSLSDGWIEGRVYCRDGAPYSGGVILYKGKEYPVNKDGSFFIGSVSTNSTTVLKLSGISEDKLYGPMEEEVRVNLKRAQGVQINIALQKVKNLFGTIIGPQEYVSQVKIELWQNSKMVKYTRPDLSGSFSFPGLAGKRYIQKIIIPTNLISKFEVASSEKEVNLEKNGDWVVIEEPIELIVK